MNEFLNENYDSKRELLNQIFVIEQLVRQAHNEIYKDNIDPWKYFIVGRTFQQIGTDGKTTTARHFGK